jgi:hypothetical protein
MTKMIDTNKELKITFKQALRIIWPYFWERLNGQFRIVFPIVGYLFLFQLFILRLPIEDAVIILLGQVFVVLGLLFFLEGLQLGLMPFSETIGAILPNKSSLYIIIGFAFLLGIGATLAEPAIGTLRSAGVNIEPGEAPLLYAMLNKFSGLLVLSVGIGVGIATVLGIMRFLFNWSLKILIIPTVIVLTGMSLYAQYMDMTHIVGLAWDAGAVTTGPVTVPLVLSVGIGVCRAMGKSDTGMSGFGIVTLASLFPIMAVLGLGFFLHFSFSVEELGALTQTMESSSDSVNRFWDAIPVEAVLVSIQAILPLSLLLFIVQRFVLRESIKEGSEIFTGILFALFGMTLFNMGLTLGLTNLGDQVGSNLPAAFSQIVTGEQLQLVGPIYIDPWGKTVALLFAIFLGYGATIAEPALNALGKKVEDITVGAFKKRVLIQAVALGVGLGMALGIAKIIFNLPILYILLPLYIFLIPLTLISSEEFVNIGWDSAGVTTGPITVPLAIAMGLGVGNNIPTIIEGFGILSAASVCPILTVLTTGLFVTKVRKNELK